MFIKKNRINTYILLLSVYIVFASSCYSSAQEANGEFPLRLPSSFNTVSISEEEPNTISLHILPSIKVIGNIERTAEASMDLSGEIGIIFDRHHKDGFLSLMPSSEYIEQVEIKLSAFPQKLKPSSIHIEEKQIVIRIPIHMRYIRLYIEDDKSLNLTDIRFEISPEVGGNRESTTYIEAEER